MNNNDKPKFKDILPEWERPRGSKIVESDRTPSFLLRKRPEAGPIVSGAGFIGNRPPRRGRLLVWLAGAAAVLAAVLFGSLFFARAEVSVTPRQETFEINHTFLAEKDSSVPGRLSFRVVSWSDKASKLISSTGSKLVERKASGTIVVYNNFSRANQPLLRNTRFQTSDGRIYRIISAIVVPGIRLTGGQTVPGSIEVTVYADKPGESFNIPDLVDFTLPGLSSDPNLYKSIYARSKTPIGGGFSGEVKIADERELEAAKKELEAKLTESLYEGAKAELPASLVFSEAGSHLEFAQENEHQKADQSDQYRLEMSGKLHQAVFDRSLLSQFIARAAVPDYNGEPVRLVEPNEIQFQLLSKNSSLPTAQSISFRLTGGGRLIWDFDEARLRAVLAGENKKDFSSIFVNFPMIKKAEVRIRPPWRRSFPDNPERIKVEILS